MSMYNLKMKAMSTEPTIEMMNEAIAIFDGWERYEDKYGIWFKREGMIKCLHPKLQELQYHTSWDWLMPVVEMLKDKLYGLWNDNQIQERPQMEISLNTNTIKLVDVETGWYLIDPISKDTLKETVYHACYEIIKWFNQQKLTNDERGTNKG